MKRQALRNIINWEQEFKLDFNTSSREQIKTPTPKLLKSSGI